MKKRRVKKSVIGYLIFVIVVTIMVLGIIYYYRNIRWSFELKKSITVNVNDSINPKDYIIKMNNVNVYYDNIDTSKAGTYKLNYIVKTKLKQKHKYNMEVIIVDNNPVINNETKPVEENKEDIPEVKPEENKPVVVKPDVKPEVKTENKVVKASSKNIEEKDGITYINGILIANKTYSLPSTYNPGGLTAETNKAANEMFAAAKAVGFNMWAQSGFRSYDYQSKLYNKYVSRDGKEAADTYSARPGHSEHQTGLAFDVCAQDKPCINSGFNNTAEAKWLSNNAHLYGFILRYPKGKTNETGYLYESWHFRYVGKELAKELYNNGNWVTLEDYFDITSEYQN